MSEWIRKEVTVQNSLGLHARPATMLAKLASRFQAQINLVCDGEVADARSALGILMLAASGGSILSIEASGEDAPGAVDEIAKLFAARFGEEE